MLLPEDGGHRGSIQHTLNRRCVEGQTVTGKKGSAEESILRLYLNSNQPLFPC